MAGPSELEKHREVKILYINIDGGRGGSGRSLYYLIKNLNRNSYIPYVVSGREGPDASRYQALGVPHEVLFLPRAMAWHRGNWYSFPLMVLQIRSLIKLVGWVLRLHREKGIDCIHYNHDSLFYVAWWIKRYLKCRVVFLIRTRLVLGSWARLQMKVICNVADHVIFITENEREHVLQFVKPETLPRHSVVHNIGEREEEQVGLKSSMARDGRFCVLSLSNISWHKGVDRLIGVAEALRSAGEKDVVFWVCGREGVAGAMNVMRDEIERKNLEDHFEFLGWVPNPEKFIRDAGAMINLTREGNPWGRDTIEAMVYGKAIITLGTYSKFMEHQETGILLEKYSPEAVAKEIIRLKREPEFRGRLEENAKARAKRLFDGPTQAHIVEGIYDNLIAEAG